MSSLGGMCERGSDISRNQLFSLLFAVRWTIQETALSSIYFQFSYTAINIKTKLALSPAPRLSDPPLSPYTSERPRCVSQSLQAPRDPCPAERPRFTPPHLSLPWKVSGELEGDGEGHGCVFPS